MATRYRFGIIESPRFITFAVINWIDALSRPPYKNIIVDSLAYCQKEKGLQLHTWIIISNHVHLIASAGKGIMLTNIIRELKKYTSKQIEQAIRENAFESRKEWMLWVFNPPPDKKIAIIRTFKFGNRIITFRIIRQRHVTTKAVISA